MNILVHISILLFLLIFCFFNTVNAQTLEERINLVLEKIDRINTFSSTHINARIEQLAYLGEKPYAKLQEGEFIFLSTKSLFKGFQFNASSLEECKNAKNMHNREIYIRVITVPGREYTQSGDGKANDVVSVDKPDGTLSSDSPMFALDFLRINFLGYKKRFLINNTLGKLLPEMIKLDDGSFLDRYEIRVSNTEETDDLVLLEFPAKDKSLFPISYSGGFIFKESNKSFWNITLTLKTDSNSPLGYSEYEYTTYNIKKTLIEDKFKFINDPNAFLKKDFSSHVTILNTPVVNGTVFPEEFSFHIPKGKALIVHNENPGSEPQRIVSEEDRIFTP